MILWEEVNKPWAVYVIINTRILVEKFVVIVWWYWRRTEPVISKMLKPGNLENNQVYIHLRFKRIYGPLWIKRRFDRWNYNETCKKIFFGWKKLMVPKLGANNVDLVQISRWESTESWKVDKDRINQMKQLLPHRYVTQNIQLTNVIRWRRVNKW